MNNDFNNLSVIILTYKTELDILEKCHAEGVAAYPEEACGFITGPSDDPDLLEFLSEVPNHTLIPFSIE